MRNEQVHSSIGVALIDTFEALRARRNRPLLRRVRLGARVAFSFTLRRLLLRRSLRNLRRSALHPARTVQAIQETVAVSDPLDRLKKKKTRAKSDVANKLIAMLLYELSNKCADVPAMKVGSDEHLDAVRTHFDNNCAFCCQPLGADAQVEHLVAMNRVRAGLHIAGNVVLSCRACNSSKRNDDQKNTKTNGTEGWDNFLSHYNNDVCNKPCKACEHWRDRVGCEDSERIKAFLKDRRKAIKKFRNGFKHASAADHIELLEATYKRFQDLSDEATKSFLDCVQKG